MTDRHTEGSGRDDKPDEVTPPTEQDAAIRRRDDIAEDEQEKTGKTDDKAPVNDLAPPINIEAGS